MHRDLKPSNILVMGEGPEQARSSLPFVRVFLGMTFSTSFIGVRTSALRWRPTYLVFHHDAVLGMQGKVKIGDFGLARIVREPLRPLYDNGVVVRDFEGFSHVSLPCVVALWHKMPRS